MIDYQRNRKLERERECRKCEDECGLRVIRISVLQHNRLRGGAHQPVPLEKKKKEVEPEGIANRFYCQKMSGINS